VTSAQPGSAPRTSALGIDVPISAVAERTGLSQATLRARQRRYGLCVNDVAGTSKTIIDRYSRHRSDRCVPL
jgi:hypothetical protein